MNHPLFFKGGEENSGENGTGREKGTRPRRGKEDIFLKCLLGLSRAPISSAAAGRGVVLKQVLVEGASAMDKRSAQGVRSAERFPYED